MRRLSLFPLAGAILFPRMHLPLHIFEPRYRAMVSDAMARDQRIGMIQPCDNGDPPGLFAIGCVGRIAEVEALDDGRFNLVLSGESRFRIVRELDVTTPFRQVEATLMEAEDAALGVLASSERAALEEEARRFAEFLGYSVQWDAVAALDDEALVNLIAQVAPFDVAAKQALLEANALRDRSEMSMQLMQFYSRGDGSNRATLQ